MKPMADERAGVADRLTDSLARHPSGWLARRFYRSPLPHLASFEATLTALALTPDDHLLEVGCGGGVLLEQALRDAGSAKAIDHSAEMVALARERNAEAIAASPLPLALATWTRPSAPSRNRCGHGPAGGRRSRRPAWNAS